MPAAPAARAAAPATPTWTLITVLFNSAIDVARYWTGPRPADVEWIVVDNGSTDGGIAAARAVGATTVIPVRRNIGFGAANNAGLAVARGRYVGFVNPDVRVDYLSLASLRAVIDRDGALVAPQLLRPDGRPQPNGRGFPTVQNKLANRIGRRHGDYFVVAGPGQTRRVCWAIGAALCGRRATIESLGGWDGRFFVYYEDSDLCLRAWLAGIPVEVCGNARWVHGWVRATARPRVNPWLHELASMRRFYRRYPTLVRTERVARARYPEIARAVGTHV